MSEKQYLTAPVASEEMPKGIPYIIGNEAAERFSFYGMKGILTIFMTKYLFLLSDTAGTPMERTEAIARYHDFTSLVYLTPVLGAFLADTILELNEINPQVSARLMRVLSNWRRFDEKRQALIKVQLERIVAHEGLSKDVFEVASKSLA